MNAAVGGRRKLLTLVELAQRAGVSMATVYRYKKHYADRLPSEGEGRQMRYPRTAVKAIQQINRELAANRGRKAPARQADNSAPALLTLLRIRDQTGISYPTLQRYVKLYVDQIPHEGEGRRRRYHPSAVDVFRRLRAESARGPGARKPAAGASAKQAAKTPPAKQLLTLTAVGQQTGISGPTLQRYLKLHGDQIPFEGEGRRRRYHPSAVDVFRRLRAESARGPGARKPAAGASAKQAAKTPRAKQLLTLTAVGQQAGISGPTLQRYLKLHGDQIPHEGEGRKRRYHPEAVAVFREIRARSGNRGRKPAAKKASGAKARTRRQAAGPSKPAGDVEARLAALEEQVRLVLRKLDQPFKLTLTR